MASASPPPEDDEFGDFDSAAENWTAAPNPPPTPTTDGQQSLLRLGAPQLTAAASALLACLGAAPRAPAGPANVPTLQQLVMSRPQPFGGGGACTSLADHATRYHAAVATALGLGDLASKPAGWAAAERRAAAAACGGEGTAAASGVAPAPSAGAALLGGGWLAAPVEHPAPSAVVLLDPAADVALPPAQQAPAGAAEASQQAVPVGWQAAAGTSEPHELLQQAPAQAGVAAAPEHPQPSSASEAALEVEAAGGGEVDQDDWFAFAGAPATAAGAPHAAPGWSSEPPAGEAGPSAGAPWPPPSPPAADAWGELAAAPAGSGGGDLAWAAGVAFSGLAAQQHEQQEGLADVILQQAAQPAAAPEGPAGGEPPAQEAALSAQPEGEAAPGEASLWHEAPGAQQVGAGAARHAAAVAELCDRMPDLACMLADAVLAPPGLQGP